MDNVKNFKERLSWILLGYRPEDVYNADESGLFYKALPDKTLALRKEKCVGGKMAKERLTILFCANMAGEKEPLLVIGKSKKPRVLNRYGMNKVPVTWYANKNAWMTTDIMSDRSG